MEVNKIYVTLCGLNFENFASLPRRHISLAKLPSRSLHRSVQRDYVRKTEGGRSTLNFDRIEVRERERETTASIRLEQSENQTLIANEITSRKN